MKTKEHFEQLARRLATRAAELQQGVAYRPTLRVVRPSPPPLQLDPLVRESHCKIIRHIRKRWRAYGDPMQALIDEACFGLAGIESLDDEGLVALHRRLELAQDCIRDGITFEDAGLLRNCG